MSRCLQYIFSWHIIKVMQILGSTLRRKLVTNKYQTNCAKKSVIWDKKFQILKKILTIQLSEEDKIMSYNKSITFFGLPTKLISTSVFLAKFTQLEKKTS